ncbi:MAG: hypothetical protein KGL44_09020 [Sphingomonadales bacterium]|nr:hypothetical protein [Sphingomonadales bacterium]
MTTRSLSLPGASCTLWPEGPLWGDGPAATIGKLDFASVEAGTAMLRQACDDLAASGARAVLAPMEGDTWHAYRVVTASDGSPPFAMEPVSGPHDRTALESAGFAPLEHYASSRAPVPPPGTPCPDVPGVSVTAWDGQRAEALLAHLHAMAAGSFADKLFFKPLDREGFLALYRPLLAMIDPRLVLFARDEHGALVGFLFGLPDLLEGPKPSQAILKTYASMRRGVGHLLAWHFHERARELGYSHVIHALMHSANVSLQRSGQHEGTVFRRYAIYGKRL